MLFETENRNFGLDIVRSIAISLVLIAHSGIHFLFGINLGFLGVEIFFVLSGFLIGQIILREFNEKVSFQGCSTFYINRWLRTFPLYYLVLLIKDLLPESSFHPAHYAFIQNNQDLTFFPVSWSLAIEEWFYILIPLVFLIKSKSIRMNMGYFVFSLMVLNIVGRFFYIHLQHPEFDLGVRKFIPLRFDSLLTGVLFSLLKVNYSSLYSKVSGLFGLTTSILLFVIGYVIYKKYVLLESYEEDGTIKDLFQTLVFVAFSFSFGFFIIWLEQNPINQVSKKNLILKTITVLSILTYAIYLIHFDIFKFFISSPPFSADWIKEMLTSSAVILTTAFLMHFILEKPIMDYRKTLIRKLFPDPVLNS